MIRNNRITITTGKTGHRLLPVSLVYILQSSITVICHIFFIQFFDFCLVILLINIAGFFCLKFCYFLDVMLLVPMFSTN